MRAFVVERYGGEAAVRAGDVPDPQVGADDVLVRIHAASVNPLDLKIRNGDLKAILPYRVPFVLGNDLAGVVVGVGAAVTRFAVGDEVYAQPGPGPDRHVRRTHRRPSGRRRDQADHAEHGRRPRPSPWSR